MPEYPRLPVTLKTGAEHLKNTGLPLSPTVLDFWQCGFSNLVDNTTRGILAEFIVASALGAVTGTRSAWDAYDLQRGTLTLEVKASAYFQAWGQNELSKILFSIRQSRAYDADENTFAPEMRRQAKIYVFCHLKHKKKDDTLNPLDASQWSFYVVPTADLTNIVRARSRSHSMGWFL